MTEDIRLEPIETEAIKTLKLDRPPCQMDIERMLHMIPRSILKRGDNVLWEGPALDAVIRC